MERALVIGTGGIGQAVVDHLRGRGVAVETLSRSDDGFDVTDPDAVAAALDALAGPFDLIFVAIGVLEAGPGPEKSLDAIEAGQMAQVMAVNAIGPALILRHVPRLMPRDGRSVVAVLSARVGSIGDNRIGGWHSYRASKAALNQILRGAAIELGRTHKQAVAVALHPGTVATPFTAKYAGRHKTMPTSEAAEKLIAVCERLTPDESGGFFDYAGKVVPW